MSADKWSVCPRCLRQGRDFLVGVLEKLKASYGRVSLAEYEDAREKYEDLVSQHAKLKSTFRSDYEVYGPDEDGVITVTYRGGCNVCKLSLNFKESRTIPEVNDDDNR